MVPTRLVLDNVISHCAPVILCLISRAYLTLCPTISGTMTVDELHQRNADLVNEHPGKVELIDLGKSADGEVIDCLKIGDGRHNALIHGFPNCEEPFGGNLLDYMAEALLQDEELREGLEVIHVIIIYNYE